MILVFFTRSNYHENKKGEFFRMSNLFSETLKKIRTERGLSQTQLGKQLFVNQSTVARWENGSRLPDATMVIQLSRVLDADVSTLLLAAAKSEESPHIIIVDDNKAILSDSLAVLDKVMPNATIRGFIWPQQAIEYAKMNQISLAVLDIELGAASGLDLCRTLLDINPRTNVVYLTAFPDYALPAWETKACGFMVKPLTPEKVRGQLEKLRFPFSSETSEGETL